MSSFWRRFKGRGNFGLLLLGVWLIGRGLADINQLNSLLGALLGVLAITSGVLLLLDR